MNTLRRTRHAYSTMCGRQYLLRVRKTGPPMAECAINVDTFLSDVHIGAFQTPSDQGTLTTRFSFTLPQDETVQSRAELDKDGDMVVARQKKHVIVIEHAMSTTLVDVGRQVWRGALLMVDYLLTVGCHRVKDSVVLELGAGTGLVSTVAASRAKHTFCTDTGQSVLELCQRNIETNTSIEGSNSRNVAVRELDWRQPFSGTTCAGFSWTQQDMECLSGVSVILASDVVYDNGLTDALFSCLAHVCSLISQPPTIIISLERRLNFSLGDLAVVSPYYQHFRSCLDTICHTSRGDIVFQAQPITTDFPQCSHYDRVKELEILQLNVTVRGTT